MHSHSGYRVHLYTHTYTQINTIEKSTHPKNKKKYTIISNNKNTKRPEKRSNVNVEETWLGGREATNTNNNYLQCAWYVQQRSGAETTKDGQVKIKKKKRKTQNNL